MEIEDECQECKKIGKCGACPVMLNWVKEHREMINIYNKNGIQIDICYDYGYF